MSNYVTFLSDVLNSYGVFSYEVTIYQRCLVFFRCITKYDLGLTYIPIAFIFLVGKYLTDMRHSSDSTAVIIILIPKYVQIIQSSYK